MAIVLDRTYTDKGIISAGSGIYVYDSNDSKYHLLIPTTDLPATKGAPETVEKTVLTDSSVTQVEGLQTNDQKEYTYNYHRDNIRALKKYAGKVCTFIERNGMDFTGEKFTGTLSMGRDAVSVNGVLQGKFYITVNSADEYPIDDIRDLIEKTAIILTPLPSVEVTVGNTQVIDLETSESASITATSEAGSIATGVMGTITYALTSDVAIVNGKDYYTRSGSGTSQSPYVYSKVATPVVGDIGTYYEITADNTNKLTITGVAAGHTLIKLVCQASGEAKSERTIMVSVVSA